MNQISQAALIELSIELAQSVSNPTRFDQLLNIVRKAIHCDAIALLVYKGEYLQPLALQGLSKECMGRRFVLEAHPRMAQICQSDSAVRFPHDSPLPDPYDGLLIDRDDDLPVHACMGLPLHFENKLIGVLTLDSLTPEVFEDIPAKTLELITSMAAVSLNTALSLELLEERVNHSKTVLKALSDPAALSEQNSMIGESQVVKQLAKDIQLVAPSNYSVLVEGESGTGKELVAHELHWQSARNNEPIVYVNCAAIPANLVESELFGHVKGAYTGADSQRAGKFLVADGGTIFLDEIGELPLAAQSKLLRVLQNQEIQQVGQDKVIKVDVRVIAATNRDLKAEAEAGRFRLDLYHRLNVYPIHVPPLRNRTGDIPLLVGFFLEKIKRKMGMGQLKLADNVLPSLVSYDWPGNIRELEHLLTRAALKASTKSRLFRDRHDVVEIGLEHCDNLTSSKSVSSTTLTKSDTGVAPIQSLREATEEFQASIIRNTLLAEKGNWSRAAAKLKTDRANLSRLAKRLGVSVEKTVT